MRLRRLLLPAGLLLLVSLWLAGWGLAKRAPRPVEALFQLELADLQGRSIRLSAWQGRPLLVNFWASWCAPCRAEMPELDRLAREKGPGLSVIGVALDDPAAVSRFLQQTPVSYPVLRAPDLSAGLRLLGELGNPSRGLPFSVFIGADGTLRWIRLGVIDTSPDVFVE